jgi:two-component system, NarL family, nitrate/nitrite response regulator NarL
MSDKIRVAVVDDHPMLLKGVVRTLTEENDIEVVGEGKSADEAFALAQKLLPDILLIDMNMPGSGLTAIERISVVCPAVKMIVLTVREDHDSVTHALERGARAYILKGVDASELVDTVRAVNDGGSYVTPSLAEKLLSNFAASHKNEAEQDPIQSLTAREEQILALLGKGLRNREIGRQLDLKEKTVKHYVTNILQKLQLRNRVEAAVLLQKQTRP